MRTLAGGTWGDRVGRKGGGSETTLGYHTELNKRQKEKKVGLLQESELTRVKEVSQ